MTAPVRIDIADRIATITIDRPDALNAINNDVMRALAEAVGRAEDGAGAIIVTGAGKAFVAGADIGQMVDLTAPEAEAFSRAGQQVFQQLADFHGPVIAAVNGYALGGGLELALACDIIVAAEGAKMGLPEVTLGVVPGFGGTQRLPRRVGPGHAKRLLLTGQSVHGEEALRIGLADVVVPAEALMPAARAIAIAALRNGPVAVREAKRLVDEGAAMDLWDAVSLEAATFGAIFDTADRKEGMQAFLEKRKAGFRGE